MEKINIPNEFIYKLKNKGAYEKFLVNLENHVKKYRKYSPLNLRMYEHSFLAFIAHAFIWKATLEGYEYWNNIAIDIDEEN